MKIKDRKNDNTNHEESKLSENKENHNIANFGKWAVFLFCSNIPSLEKYFCGNNHLLSSSPSSIARLSIESRSFRAIVDLPEQGKPVIQSTNVN